MLRCSTSEQASYRLLRLFYKSQSALIFLPLLSKSQPLALGCDLVLGADLEVFPQNCSHFPYERGSTFGTVFLDCPKSRPLFYPQGLAIQGFFRDKLSVRIWTFKSKQLKTAAKATGHPFGCPVAFVFAAQRAGSTRLTEILGAVQKRRSPSRSPSKPWYGPPSRL